MRRGGRKREGEIEQHARISQYSSAAPNLEVNPSSPNPDSTRDHAECRSVLNFRWFHFSDMIQLQPLLLSLSIMHFALRFKVSQNRKEELSRISLSDTSQRYRRELRRKNHKFCPGARGDSSSGVGVGGGSGELHMNKLSLQNGRDTRGIHVQRFQKRLVNQAPAAGDAQIEGFTQPRTILFGHLGTVPCDRMRGGIVSAASLARVSRNFEGGRGNNERQVK